MLSVNVTQEKYDSKVIPQEHRHLLPKIERYHIEAKFSHLYYCNAIRRVIINEMKRYALVVDSQDITLMEKNYSSDCIADRLRYMPISQEFPHLTAELRIANKTQVNREIYSSDIKFKSISGPVLWEKVVEKYPLMTLEPGGAVVIANIKALPLYAYEKKGSPPYAVVTKYLPNKKELHVRTLPFANTDILQKAVLSLIQRFNVVKTAIESENASIVAISQLNKLHKFTFFNETMTVGNTLHKKILEMEPNIGFISCAEEHPSRRSFVLTMIHPHPTVVVLEAITNIIKDLS